MTNRDRQMHDLGRWHYQQDRVVMTRPRDWTMGDWDAYWLGVNAEDAETRPDIGTAMGMPGLQFAPPPCD